MAALELIVREGPEPGRVIPLPEGEAQVLGRGTRSDIRMEDDRVSRRHCRIQQTADGLRVTDLDSANGTFVDGDAVDEAHVAAGETFRVGPVVLECRAGKEPDEKKTVVRVAPGGEADGVVSRVEKPSTPGTEPEAPPGEEAELDSARRNLEIAYRLSRALARTKDPDQLVNRIIDKVFTVIDADQVAILRRSDGGDGDSDDLELAAVQTREGLSPHEVVVSTSVVDEVLEESVSTLSTHAQTDERYGDAESVVAQKIQSVLCAPLQSEEGTLGVLYADNRRGPAAFTETDLQLLAVIANEAGTAWRRTQLATELEQFFLDTVRAVVAAVDAKDGYTHRHSERVASFAVQLARELGVRDEEALERVRLAGLLHDIGKIGVPDRILNKTGDLTDEEFREIQKHPEHGEEILGQIRSPRFRRVLPAIRHHHEQWDGSGYPDGLAEEEIPRHARLLAVADVLDALTSNRSYREAFDLDRAVTVIDEDAGSHFDPEVAAAATSLHDRGDLGAREASPQDPLSVG